MSAAPEHRFDWGVGWTFEALEKGVGPVAYGWRQGKLHLTAKRIYDAGGVAAPRR